jgi:hypothetical protein
MKGYIINVTTGNTKEKDPTTGKRKRTKINIMRCIRENKERKN